MKQSLIAGALALMPLPAAAAELGGDGLHAAPWIVESFKDLPEDLAEAAADGRRLMVLIEQRGCIYCTRMHEEVFPVPDIERALSEDFLVVRLDMFGAREVTDFDGEVLSEKQAVRKWRVNFTPTMLFFPEDVPDGTPAGAAAVVTMPGAFGIDTVRSLLAWILDRGYEGEEPFQAYHARRMTE